MKQLEYFFIQEYNFALYCIALSCFESLLTPALLQMTLDIMYWIAFLIHRGKHKDTVSGVQYIAQVE